MYKFVILLFLGVLLGLSQNAAAQFVGDTNSIQTVTDLKEMQDNSWFTLEGHIVKQVREEKYLFRDQSGEIEVEIDSDKWKGRKVDSGTKIRISGKVEKGWLSSMEVEVKRIEIIDGNVKDQGEPNSPQSQ